MKGVAMVATSLPVFYLHAMIEYTLFFNRYQ